MQSFSTEVSNDKEIKKRSFKIKTSTVELFLISVA